MENKKQYFKIGRYYLHYTPLKLVLVFSLFVILSLWVYTKDNLVSLFFLIFGGIFLILSLLVLIRYSKQEYYSKDPQTIFNAEIEFKSDYIFFKNFFHHNKSSLKNSNIVKASSITEVNLKRWPRELVLNGNEVVFVNTTQDEELIAFCKINNIPITDRFDIWEAISRPYLDTELDETENEYLFQKLKENGFEKEEVLKIRKKIRLALLATTYATWEWVHYGHWDVLRSILPTKKNYWWTMEIALRNLKKNNL